MFLDFHLYLFAFFVTKKEAKELIKILKYQLSNTKIKFKISYLNTEGVRN